MSTTTLDRPVAPAYRLTFGHVVASEWRKSVSLRSTWWTLGVALVLQVGTAALFALAMRSGSAFDGEADATGLATAGLEFAQLAVVALGVLAISAEYSSGQVRVTFAAVPRRMPVLVAKLLVLSGVVAVMGVVSTVISVGVVKLVGGHLARLQLGEAQTWRMLYGAPLYLVGIAGLSLALGFLMRSTAAAIATLMGFLLVVQTVFLALNLKVVRVISPWLPGTAGQQIMASDNAVAAARAARHVGVVLTPWQGYLVLVGWVVLLLVGAAVTLRRRDV